MIKHSLKFYTTHLDIFKISPPKHLLEQWSSNFLPVNLGGQKILKMKIFNTNHQIGNQTNYSDAF